jgi:hypothetical protein
MTSILVSILTGITIVYLSYHYLKSYSSRITALALWAFSPFFIQLDRVPWNPNLSLIAALFVFFPLYHLSSRVKVTQQHLIHICIGSFLGYQAHFAGFILPVITLIFVILFHKPIFLFLSSLIGIGISILPTLIFDLNHHFINLKGFGQLIYQQSPSSTNFLIRLTAKLYITIENIGKLVFLPYSQLILPLGFIIILITLIQLFKHRSNRIKFIAIWIISYPVLYSFYGGPTPEYYFLMQLPAIIILYAMIVRHVQPRILNYIPIIVMLIISTIYVINYYTHIQTFGIYNQITFSNSLYSLSKNHPISHIKYQNNINNSYGLRYLNQKISLDPKGDQLIIDYTNDINDNGSEFNGLVFHWGNSHNVQE